MSRVACTLFRRFHMHDRGCTHNELMHAEYCLGNDSAVSEELGLCKKEQDLNCGQAPGDEVCDGERSIATWKSSIFCSASFVAWVCSAPRCPACVRQRL